jgi:hypothetical protein
MIFMIRFSNTKAIGIMVTESKETNFPNYLKVTNHMDYGNEDNH